MPTFEFESTLATNYEDVFAWHRRPGALSRLIPAWIPAQLRQESHGLTVGDRVRFTVGPMHLESVHTELSEPANGTGMFVDELRKGPVHWRHQHEFRSLPNDGTSMRDIVRWASPLLPDSLIQKQLTRMCVYRHQQLATDLAMHARTSKKLVVAISGASGLIGSRLAAFLSTGGHTVFRLVRRPAKKADEITWNPNEGTIDLEKLEQCNAVVHLAGEPLFGRWSRHKMRKIRKSRIVSTQLLADTLAHLSAGPTTLLCASAIGYYANSDHPLDETGEKGAGFLSDLVQDWESAADSAREAGVRVVHSRTGLVLSPQSGMLGMQLPAFRAGIGGPLGNGTQKLSWISEDDAIYLLHHALVNDDVVGPLNLVGPRSVTGREFARCLGRVLHRPSLVKVPMTVVRLALGATAAQELAAASQWVLPGQAIASGYPFQYPELESALRHLLGR